jgi:hypothetical protein
MAWDSLVSAAQIQAGETILIVGAASEVLELTNGKGVDVAFG